MSISQNMTGVPKTLKIKRVLEAGREPDVCFHESQQTLSLQYLSIAFSPLHLFSAEFFVWKSDYVCWTWSPSACPDYRASAKATTQTIKRWHLNPPRCGISPLVLFPSSRHDRPSCLLSSRTHPVQQMRRPQIDSDYREETAESTCRSIRFPSKSAHSLHLIAVIRRVDGFR